MANPEIQILTTQIHALTYLELSDLARPIIAALSDNPESEQRMIEDIPAEEADKMARAILDGASYWNEISNS